MCGYSLQELLHELGGGGAHAFNPGIWEEEAGGPQ